MAFLPVIATAATTAAQIGGPIIGAVAAFQGAQRQRNIAEQNARLASQTAAVEEDRIRRDRRRRLGATRAAFGAAGVQLEGSPIEVLADSAAEAELDALLARFGGRLSSAEQRGRARAAEAEGFGALIRGAGRGGTRLLGGINDFFESRQPPVVEQ